MMKAWKMRGAAALAILTLAIAGCQNQGADDSLDTLPSMDMESMGTESMGTESMDMESMEDDPSDDADASDEAEASDDS